ELGPSAAAGADGRATVLDMWRAGAAAAWGGAGAGRAGSFGRGGAFAMTWVRGRFAEGAARAVVPSAGAGGGLERFSLFLAVASMTSRTALECSPKSLTASGEMGEAGEPRASSGRDGGDEVRGAGELGRPALLEGCSSPPSA